MKRRNFLKHQSAKHYKRKRFRNPYFHYRNSVPRSVLLFALLGVFLPALLLLWIFTASSWRSTDINIVGLTTIPLENVIDLVEQDIDGKRLLIFPKNHRLFLQEELLVLHLEQEFDFAKVTLEQKKDQLLITVEESISELVFVQNRTAHLLLLDGTIRRQLTPQEQEDIIQRTGVNLNLSVQEEDARILQPTAPVIVLGTGENDTAEDVLDPIEPSFFITLDAALRQQLIEPIVYELDMSQTSWTRVKTTQGIDLLFDGLEDIDVQLSVLDIVLAEYQQSLNESEYIDLRFGNRVYVK